MTHHAYPFYKKIAIEDGEAIKDRIIQFLLPQQHFIFLDNNGHTKHPYHEMELMACVSTQGLKKKIDENRDEKFYFGHLLYDLKNEFEQLKSDHSDYVQWQESGFYEADIVLQIVKDELEIWATTELDLSFLESKEKPAAKESKEVLSWRNRFQKEEYIATINDLKNRIVEGDLYEINICMEQYVESVQLDIFHTFKKLNQKNKAPFTALYREGEHYLLCASPERFLVRKEDKICSQPIKGTARKADDPDEDLYIKLQLASDVKERAENVMIVDLVRNDLAKISEVGTVRVDELMEIYTFEKVHQMISSISAQIPTTTSLYDILKACFPMGSMTGAPKIISCEYIEKFEKSRRGLFSGSVGFITPQGDFDFNVVIRSLIYNASTGYLSLPTGSAITFLSDAEREWEECLLKSESVKESVVLC